MNCNWQNDAVKLPRVALSGDSVVDDEDDGDCNSSNETHSDSASMPYQYLIERDIEREKKNSRIAEALSKKSSSDASAEARGSVTCQSNEVDESFQPPAFVEHDISNVRSPDCAFGQSTHAFMDEHEDSELDAFNRMVDDDEEEEVVDEEEEEGDEEEEEEDEEEDEDIVPEALVNNSYFNGGFGQLDKLSSRSHFEGLLMDDIEPNDEKIVYENHFRKTTSPSSSSSRPLAINGTCFINDSDKLPKVISNEIITKDQLSPALLKVLNKSSIDSYRSETNVCNKTENFSSYNNIKSEPESLKDEGKANIVNNANSNNARCNVVSLSQDNIRVTRSNVKLFAKSNILSRESINSTTNQVNSTAMDTRIPLKKSPSSDQLNPVYKNEEYEVQCRNVGTNSVAKNVNSFGIDGTLDKRVKINSRKLINDLTYGIKIVVERLDLSRIPR
jgi:hypothetical protein